MKLLRFLSLSAIAFIFCNLFAQDLKPYKFINPKPTSNMVSAETNIILKHSSIIDKTSLSSNLIRVEGSKSGEHGGDLILSDDNRTIVFNPYKTFLGNEEVNVVIMNGLKTQSGDNIPEFTFGFTTAPSGIVQFKDAAFKENPTLIDNSHSSLLKVKDINETLSVPAITIDYINNPSPGYIFMATWDRNVPAIYGNFILVLDSAGVIVDSVRVKGAPFDFQVQPNGLLSYALGDFTLNVPLPGQDLRNIVLDENLAVVDSFKMKNGYTTDFHEFKLLPNGHAIMMSYHTIMYDMSKIVPGGKTDASLVINIIQEQDQDKNVVFEWRDIDYISIIDSDLDLTGPRMNYTTLNAFDIDDDGNILTSHRNLSEIMKISRETGEVMWRMGGPRGEFTFVGENEGNAPYYHSRQHNIRRRPNGNITMFDNGQHHQPPYSRAVEYSLDEVNKVATMVSEWRYPTGNIFCMTAGNAETLQNGGWFIGYGVPNPQFIKRNAVEVHPDGSIALEISLPPGVLAYRTYKFPWNEFVNKPSFTHFEVKQGNTYSFNNEAIVTGVEIEYTALNAADYNESKITRLPYGPVSPEFTENIRTISPVSIIYKGLAINSQTAEFQIDLAQYPEITNPENTIIYHRVIQGQGLFISKPTIYDNIENKLMGTLDNFGEIVFGIPMDITDSNIPIQYDPMNGKKLVLQDTIIIKWTGKGYYNSFNVQVSTDSLFNSILYETNTNNSQYAISGLSNNTKYFWRVNSVHDAQISQWSEVWSFEIADPYIKIISPNGYEIWAIGSSEIIRWETNILGNARIVLIRNQNIISALDTIPGNYQAYEWNLPGDLIASETYKFQISSESDASVFGLSSKEFSIINTNTGITGNNTQIPDKFNLAQNYPNPFNPTTVINYQLSVQSSVELSIYNLLGEKMTTIVNMIQPAGNYKVQWDAIGMDSGIYFYNLQTDKGFSQTKKLVIIK